MKSPASIVAGGLSCKASSTRTLASAHAPGLGLTALRGGLGSGFLSSSWLGMSRLTLRSSTSRAFMCFSSSVPWNLICSSRCWTYSSTLIFGMLTSLGWVSLFIHQVQPCQPDDLFHLGDLIFQKAVGWGDAVN